MAADLELRHIPCGILVGRPLDVAELGLVGREVIVDVQRQLDWTTVSTSERNFANRRTFQELVSFVPINFGIEQEVRPRVSLHGCYQHIC